MYTQSAHIYDALYLQQGKDYSAEVVRLRAFAQQYQKSDGKALLDVACGTGMHASYLAELYQVEGLDLDEQMLAVARKNYPDIPFHHGDMRTFDLARRFHIVTCLFSAIGYMKDTAELQQAIAAMSAHIYPGGVLLVEPWFTPEQWHPGGLHATSVDQPELKIMRMNISESKGNKSFFTFHYLVGTPQGIEYFTEYHELTLFTRAEYLEAFRANNLEVVYDEKGLSGRGLYIGLKAAK
jgi:ubiquinone/menaquinone biosynthesis C-methylase UbiE